MWRMKAIRFYQRQKLLRGCIIDLRPILEGEKMLERIIEGGKE